MHKGVKGKDPYERVKDVTPSQEGAKGPVPGRLEHLGVDEGGGREQCPYE